MSRKAYPTGVGDEEWDLVAPYLTLIREDAVQRVDALRELFNALRWLVKAGCPWRLLPRRPAALDSAGSSRPSAWR